MIEKTSKVEFAKWQKCCHLTLVKQSGQEVNEEQLVLVVKLMSHVTVCTRHAD